MPIAGFRIAPRLDLRVAVVPQAQEVHHVVQVLFPEPVGLVIQVEERPRMFGGDPLLNRVEVMPIAHPAVCVKH